MQVSTKTIEMLDSNGLKSFPQELVQRVEDNWLTKENSFLFEGLSDRLKCMQFVYLSQFKGEEISLRDDISQVVVDKMLFNR